MIQPHVRTARLAALGLLAILAGLMPAAALQVSGSDAASNIGVCLNPTASWGQFRYDPAHTGNNAKNSCITSQNILLTKSRWHHGADGIYSDPVISVGRDVLTTRGHNHCTGIEALNTANGKVVWSHGLMADKCTDPVIAGTSVILLQRNPLFVNAWNLKNGKRLWHKTLKPAKWSSLTLVGKTLYAESARGQVLALQASNGSQIWSEFLNAHLTDFTPAVSNGRMYVTSQTGHVYALALSATGARLAWTAKTGGSSMMGTASLAVSAGMLFVACGDGKIYGVNLQAHKLMWKATFAYFNADLATDGARVYVTSPPNGPHGSGPSVFALNGKTGKVVWSFGTSFVGEKPEVANGVVYVSNDGVGATSKIFGLDAMTGKRLWSAQGAGSYPSYPSVTGNWVFLSNYAYGIP